MACYTHGFKGGKRMEFREQLRELAFRKIEHIMVDIEENISFAERKAVQDFFILFVEEEEILLELYRANKNGLHTFEITSQEGLISYTYENASCTISFSEQRFTIAETHFRHLFECTIEMMRELLPLGTVVELDPNYFKPDEQSSTPTKVVITGRFIAPQNYNSYFPYAGVVYPLGEIKKGSQIYFTKPLIQSIVHLGFQDDMEKAFEILMKEELIVEKDLKSIEFSGDDMKRLENELESQKAGDS